jgi:hypothetical protein
VTASGSLRETQARDASGLARRRGEPQMDTDSRASEKEKRNEKKRCWRGAPPAARAATHPVQEGMSACGGWMGGARSTGRCARKHAKGRGAARTGPSASLPSAPLRTGPSAPLRTGRAGRNVCVLRPRERQTPRWVRSVEPGEARDLEAGPGRGSPEASVDKFSTMSRLEERGEVLGQELFSFE